MLQLMAHRRLVCQEMSFDMSTPIDIQRKPGTYIKRSYYACRYQCTNLQTGA